MTEAPTIQRRNVYVGVGLTFALLVALYFVYQIGAVVLVLLLTLLFSIIISGPVDYLARKGIGRSLGTLIVLGGLSLALTLASLALVPAIEDQAQQLVEDLPALLSTVQWPAEELQSSIGLEVDFTPDPQQVLDSARNFLSGGAISTFVSVGASVANIVSFGVVVLISTIFAVARPEPLVNGFVALYPAGWRERVREILKEMYKNVQRWFLGQLVSMTVIGLLFTVSLFMIGIPFALLLGILSGLLAFIPFIGPLISVIPPILLALADEPVRALWVILAYAGIQFVEGNIIQPVVMSRVVSLHPVIIIFALLIMGTLFGFVGVLIAIPLTAALHVLVREMWIKRMDEKGTDPNPPLKEEASPMKQSVGRLWRAIEALFRRS
ncbi:MAG: AI-2E family transporter [Actinomycetota bacterium]|nr:AI-2E family transporter [Actinomycetota bacterium]